MAMSEERLNLGQLCVGDTVRVVGLDKVDRSYREKLLAFGLTRGTALSLRRGEASAVAVELCEAK